MPVRYFEAPDVKLLAEEIIDCLGLYHVVPQFLFCYRSTGSSSDRIIARIHGLSRMWQEALNLPASYSIEVISEKYDGLNQKDKEKTIIHELLHVPKTFAGGFRPHKGYINEDIVSRLHDKLVEQRHVKALVDDG